MDTHDSEYDFLLNHFNTLKSSFGDALMPTNLAEWKIKFDELSEKSKNRHLPLRTYLWQWIQLIISAKQFKNDSSEGILYNSYNIALNYLPMKMFESDSIWSALIDGIYSHIFLEEMDSVIYTSLLKQAEEKFSYSLVHANLYWEVVLRHETELMEKHHTPAEKKHQQIAELFKKSLRFPYCGFSERYKSFISWAKDIKLDDELINSVRESYSTIPPKLKQLISAICKKQEDESTNHSDFQELVDEICQFPVNINTLQTVCEEMIEEKPDSLCFYYIYLHALSSTMRSNSLKPMPERIEDVILRGLQSQTKECCSGITECFFEQAFIIASQHLTKDQILGLIYQANQTRIIKNHVRTRHSFSKGALFAINNLVHQKQMSLDDLDLYFNKLIEPCQLSYFSQSSDPPAEQYDHAHQVLYLDLLRLWVTMREAHCEYTWPQLLEWWTSLFYNCSNPIYLVGYVDFVKNRGNKKEALEAANFALLSVKKNYDSIPYMRSHLKLLKQHVDILITSGGGDQLIDVACELHKRFNFYNLKHPNKFDDLGSGLDINGFSPLMSLESNVFKNSQISDDNSIQTIMDSLRMDTDHNDQQRTKFDQSKIERKDVNMKKVFAQNLKFTATEEDLASALKLRGFYPTEIKILRTKDGKSRGLAYITFNCKDVAYQVIETCSGIDICGRNMYLSQYVEKASWPTPPVTESAKSTVLILSGLDEEFRDEDRLRNLVSAYGHIKDVSLINPDDFIVKLEFHFHEDALTVKTKVVEEKILGSQAKCRLAFAKKLNKTKKEITYSKQKKPSITERPRSSLPVSTTDAPDNIGPQVPAYLQPRSSRQIVKREFVPRQAVAPDEPIVIKRSRMRLRLDSVSTTASTVPYALFMEEWKRAKMEKERMDDLKSILDVSTSSTASTASSIPSNRSKLDVSASSTASTVSTASFPSYKDWKREKVEKEERMEETNNWILPTATSSPICQDEAMGELEFAMEGVSSTNQLTNEDFRNMLKKN